MNQTRRGATLKKRGPSWHCPNGCNRNRTWTPEELESLETEHDAEAEREALMREDALAARLDWTPF